MPNSGDWSVIGQSFYMLAVFGVLIALTYFCVRKLGGAGLRGSRGGNIKIIDVKSITPQAGVQLIQIGRRIFLIGVTKEHIDLVAELTDQVEHLHTKDIRVKDNSIDTPNIFARYLSRAQNKYKEKDKPGEIDGFK
ncbi:MAG: flagellar biosynthetic protein FliO [Clostridiales bacterium]|jgi:flagellar biogenesis protein FliO|nr:flagellar biosynthetic protein FliO [Clostridiales bacterium]